MTCQKKIKKSCAFYLSFLLVCLVVVCCVQSVPSYASETSTETVQSYFQTHNFYDTCAYVCRKYASFPYIDYLTGSQTGITYDAFADYCESKGLGNLLQESVIVTEGSGGRGYDIPQDVRQELVNFVSEVYIEDNPLSYTQCYVSSYNFIDASLFPSYGMYTAVKEYMKTHDGYHIIQYIGTNYGNVTECRICTLSHNYNLGFIGTVQSGIFNNVHVYKDWQSNFAASGVLFRANGTTVVQDNQSMNIQLHNTTALTLGNVFTSYDKNELVYVFQTLNAFKAYTGQAQPYYLPSNSQINVPYYDGFTDSDLRSAGNFYNNIVVNAEGQTPNNIRKTTDSVLGSLDGIFGGSDSESSSGGLFDSLGDIITGATGAISPIKEIVLGDIKELVADVFDFLPPTIITLWVSGIIFGIFFGVLKLIRG